MNYKNIKKGEIFYMPTEHTFKTGWLEDYGEIKFAPNTFFDQIYMTDGKKYNTHIEEEFETLWDAVKYIPISIVSANSSASNVTGYHSGLNAEAGSKLGTITFNWTTNKTPEKVEIFKGNILIATPSATTTSYNATAQNITSDTTYVLKITEKSNPAVDTQAVATKNFTYSFKETCYYGVLNSGTTPTSANIVALSKKYFLTGNSTTSFTANAGNGQHLVFATPQSFGTPTFKVGGFAGGFYKHSTINLTNESGKTQKYDIYYSDQLSLGSTTVDVSL